MKREIDDYYEKMKNGNSKQQAAYEAIQALNVLNELHRFHPLVCGTIPIGIDIATSDLDIIMEVEDFHLFEKELHRLYKGKEHFRMKRKVIKGSQIVKANFTFLDFEFELFGQSHPVTEQNAFLHMVIEGAVLESRPELRKKVIDLKMAGSKTEEAFCELLDISGDPFEGLIRYGIEEGII